MPPIQNLVAPMLGVCSTNSLVALSYVAVVSTALTLLPPRSSVLRARVSRRAAHSLVSGLLAGLAIALLVRKCRA